MSVHYISLKDQGFEGPSESSASVSNGISTGVGLYNMFKPGGLEDVRRATEARTQGEYDTRQAINKENLDYTQFQHKNEKRAYEEGLASKGDFADAMAGSHPPLPPRMPAAPQTPNATEGDLNIAGSISARSNPRGAPSKAADPQGASDFTGLTLLPKDNKTTPFPMEAGMATTENNSVPQAPTTTPAPAAPQAPVVPAAQTPTPTVQAPISTNEDFFKANPGFEPGIKYANGSQDAVDKKANSGQGMNVRIKDGKVQDLSGDALNNSDTLGTNLLKVTGGAIPRTVGYIFGNDKTPSWQEEGIGPKLSKPIGNAMASAYSAVKGDFGALARAWNGAPQPPASEKMPEAPTLPASQPLEPNNGSKNDTSTGTGNVSSDSSQSKQGEIDPATWKPNINPVAEIVHQPDAVPDEVKAGIAGQLGKELGSLPDETKQQLQKQLAFNQLDPKEQAYWIKKYPTVDVPTVWNRGVAGATGNQMAGVDLNATPLKIGQSMEGTAPSGTKFSSAGNFYNNPEAASTLGKLMGGTGDNAPVGDDFTGQRGNLMYSNGVATKQLVYKVDPKTGMPEPSWEGIDEKLQVQKNKLTGAANDRLDKLATEFSNTKAATEYKQQQGNLVGIQNLLKEDPNGISDQELLTTISRMGNPGAIAREGTVEQYQNATGVIGKLEQFSGRVKSGLKLEPAQRTQILRAAKDYYGAYQKMYANERTRYMNRARGFVGNKVGDDVMGAILFGEPMAGQQSSGNGNMPSEDQVIKAIKGGQLQIGAQLPNGTYVTQQMIDYANGKK